MRAVPVATLRAGRSAAAVTAYDRARFTRVAGPAGAPDRAPAILVRGCPTSYRTLARSGGESSGRHGYRLGPGRWLPPEAWPMSIVRRSMGYSTLYVYPSALPLVGHTLPLIGHVLPLVGRLRVRRPSRASRHTTVARPRAAPVLRPGSCMTREPGAVPPAPAYPGPCTPAHGPPRPDRATVARTAAHTGRLQCAIAWHGLKPERGLCGNAPRIKDLRTGCAYSWHGVCMDASVVPAVARSAGRHARIVPGGSPCMIRANGGPYRGPRNDRALQSSCQGSGLGLARSMRSAA